MHDTNIAVFASEAAVTFRNPSTKQLSQVDSKQILRLLFVINRMHTVVERAKACGIPCFVVPPKNYENKEATTRSNSCRAPYPAKVEFLVLAGYMRLVGSAFSLSRLQKSCC